jgi:thioredoxin reductase (NADPH)
MRSADLVIVGAGTAGLTAAAAAAACGLDVLVFEHLAPGGQIATVEKIRNFPAHPEGVGGYELGPMLLQQAEEAGAQFLFDTVERIERSGHRFVVGGTEGDVDAAAVLLAMGSRRRSLGVPGEAAFEGRGVSHCASCDGQFFRGKVVAVAGGGDSAFDEAEILAEHASEVVILHHGATPVAQPRIVERVLALPNIRTIAGADIVAVEGGGEVERLIVDLPQGRTVQPASGLFVYVGLTPNSELAAGMAEVDARGAILADADFQTSTPGIFVAGDLRSGATAWLSSVAGDGASAAVAAVRYIRATGGSTGASA